MIKINLLRDSNSMSDASGTSIGFSSQSAVVDSKDLLIKGLFVVLPMLGYYVYDMQAVQTKKDRIQQFQAQIVETDKELATLNVQVKEVERFLEEKRKLNSQLDTIKKLSKERLRNVKSLDALQNIIPQKAWLTSLSIKDINVQIEGQAVDDIVISDFMRDLDESVFFANVVLEASEELKRDDGNVRKFKVKATLENL